MALAPHVKITARSFPVAFTVGGTPTSDFDFAGPFWDSADILVYRDGVMVDSSLYTVTGLYVQDGLTISGAYGGGTVHFLTPVTSAEITIDRHVQLIRDTDFSSAPLSMTALNSDLDKGMAIDQDLEARITVLEQGAEAGGSATDWPLVTNKPANITAFASLIGAANKLAYFTAAGALALSDLSPYSRTLLALTSKAAWQAEVGGGGGPGGSGYPPLIDTFGTIDGGGVNTTDNDATLALVEADANWRYSVPAGVFATTRTEDLFSKGYEGEGIFTLADGSARPAKFAYIKTAPTLWPVQGAAGWFRGDQRFTDGGEWKIIGPGTRAKTTARYYESAFIPHHSWFQVYDGGSSVTCRLSVAASTASNQVTVAAVSTADVLNKQVIFTATPDGTPLDTRTVTAVAGNVLTLSANPSANHPIGTIITVSKRTWAGHTYVKVDHHAEGDAYGHIVRTNMYNGAKAGQRHVFESGTIGQYGGDANFLAGSSGSYATNLEFVTYDQGNDVAHIGYVSTHVRTVDTGARSAMWLGMVFKSEGSKPADAVLVAKGAWRTALDTTTADLSTFASAGDNKHVAINTKLEHQWYMNSTASSAGRTGSTDYGTFFGNTLGDMSIGSTNDGTSDIIDIQFRRAAPNNSRIRMRPDSINVRNQLNCSAAINAGTYFMVGGLKVVGARGTDPGNATGLGDVVTVLNAWLAEARTHGLI